MLTPETIKLLRSTKNKITKDGVCENVIHLETNKSIAILSTIIVTIIQESHMHLFLTNGLVNY